MNSQPTIICCDHTAPEVLQALSEKRISCTIHSKSPCSRSEASCDDPSKPGTELHDLVLITCSTCRYHSSLDRTPEASLEPRYRDTAIDTDARSIEQLPIAQVLHRDQVESLQQRVSMLTEENRDYDAILNVLETISTCAAERELIDSITDTLAVLLSADRVRYLSADQSSREDRRRHRAILETRYALSADDAGFAFGLFSHDQLIGVFVLEGFLFTDDLETYAAFCLRISTVLTTSLINIRHRNRIIDLSRYDSLTGLFNRACFTEQLLEMESEESPAVTILVCDIDHLHRINDTKGEQTGDSILRRMTELLHMSFRQGDQIFRIGGDEFAVIIRDSAEASSAGITSRLSHNLNLIRERPQREFITAELSFSCGKAQSSECGSCLRDTYRLAQQRMYEDKQHKDTAHFS
jgi:diguanylate cyclase (GGDEF)-like protein